VALPVSLQSLYDGWASLGLPFHGTGCTPALPEALVIGLVTVGRYDQRLFDEALSFLHRNPRIFRSNYFKAWHKFLQPDDQQCLQDILEFCSIKGFGASSNSTKKPERLFLHEQTGFVGPKLDPWFESKGWVRNPFEPSTMTPDLKQAALANPWVKMRLSFGILAPSDTLVLAVNSKVLSAPKLGLILGISPKSAWSILQDHVLAGWLTVKTVGRKDFYRPTKDFLKSFSWLRQDESLCTPLDWIESSFRQRWKAPASSSKDYLLMWQKDKEMELEPLQGVRDRLQMDYL
jgi:hypothetical protein